MINATSSAPISPTLSDKTREILIRAAYETLLGREADVEGLKGQTGALVDCTALPAVVSGFLESAEGQMRKISGLDLAHFLDRAAATAGDNDLNSTICAIAESYLRAAPLEANLTQNEPKPLAPLSTPPTPLLAVAQHSRNDRVGLSIFVMGGTGAMLRVETGKGEVIRELSVERGIQLFKFDLALGAEDPQGLSATIPALGLKQTFMDQENQFLELVDRQLKQRPADLADPSRFRAYAPPATDVLIDRRLAALYGLHHGLDADEAYCARHAERILAWYVTEWPFHPDCNGRIALSPAQCDHLRAPLLDADLLGFPVTRHIFHFARKHQMLDGALESLDGIIDVYARYFCSTAYRRLADMDLVPAWIVNALAAPVSMHKCTLNRFWQHVFDGPEGMALATTSQEELTGMCAEAFAQALLNDLYEKLIPAEWFRLYKNGLPSATEAPVTLPRDIDADPLLTKLAGARARAVLTMLREAPLEDIFRQGWRAAAGHRTASLNQDDRGHPVTVIGHDGSSGLGKNMKMFTGLFRRGNIAFRSLDVDRMQGEESLLAEGRQRFARGVNLFAVNADRFSRAAAGLPSPNGAAANVGFFLWETTRAPRLHRPALDFADEIWTPTEFVRDIYRNLSQDRVNVVNVGKHVEVPASIPPYPLANLGIGPEAFTFLNIADFDSSITRKNPLPVVRAFRQAFPKDRDVRLILKIRRIDPSHWSNTNNYWDQVLEAIGNDERISILTGDLPEADYWGLLQAADCYVSLHRAEGFGYGAAHAMLLDVPVITTDFSGTQDFCTTDTAFLVPGEEIPVRIGDMLFNEDLGVWAEADVEMAARQMATVRAGGQAVKNITQAAHNKIERDYSFDRFSQRVLGRITALTR